MLKKTNEPSKSKKHFLANTTKSFWSDSIESILKNKLAMVCILVIALFAVISVIAPMICQYDYQTTDYLQANKAPSGEHLFGTDILGRDMWVRIWKGVAVSLLIGILGAIIPQIIGVIIGSISGYIGGMVDLIFMNVVDMFVCVPSLVYITLISIWLKPSIWSVIFAISISSWMETARLVRGRVMQFKNREFVLASIAQGASGLRVIVKHVLPNIMGTVIISVFSAIPTAIFLEAYLSFIGLGASSTISLGQLCRSGVSMYRLYPYQLFIPGVIISLLILAFYVLGNCLNDAFDVRLRK